MSERIERRIERLESEYGVGAVDAEFLASLDAADAAFYRAVMRRPGSGGDFALFLRSLTTAELERLLDIYRRHLAADGIDLDTVLAADHPLARSAASQRHDCIGAASTRRVR